MKFLVSTSKEQPKLFENATKIVIVEKKGHNCTEEEYNAHQEAVFGSKKRNYWRLIGHDHAVTETGIVRYFDNYRWYIEINSLEEILNLCDKMGSITMSVSVDGLTGEKTYEINETDW